MRVDHFSAKPPLKQCQSKGEKGDREIPSGSEARSLPDAPSPNCQHHQRYCQDPSNFKMKMDVAVGFAVERRVIHIPITCGNRNDSTHQSNRECPESDVTQRRAFSDSGENIRQKRNSPEPKRKVKDSR